MSDDTLFPGEIPRAVAPYLVTVAMTRPLTAVGWCRLEGWCRRAGTRLSSWPPFSYQRAT